MTVATTQQGGGYVERGGSGSLADVVELILDKGLVIDVFVRVSLVGIEILTIDARIVVASVDTFLRFAEATNRLDLYGAGKGGKDLTDLTQGMMEGGAKGKTSGVLDAAADKVEQLVGRKSDNGDGDDDGDEERPRRRPRARARERAE
ncbi:gas vesicle protein GvpJ [Pseudonocardia sp. CA-107938]|uniref:gas vesicle protein GvpJ n=1 Tax=Pseudonocardia sp. CA-107938 TaxID=3240021 RepID=UPI003D93C77E